MSIARLGLSHPFRFEVGFAGLDRIQLLLGTVDIHPVDTVAGVAVAFRLKYQLRSIERKIGFCIFAAECELFYVCKMLFARNLKRVLGVEVDS